MYFILQNGDMTTADGSVMSEHQVNIAVMTFACVQGKAAGALGQAEWRGGRPQGWGWQRSRSRGEEGPCDRCTECHQGCSGGGHCSRSPPLSPSLITSAQVSAHFNTCSSLRCRLVKRLLPLLPMLMHRALHPQACSTPHFLHQCLPHLSLTQLHECCIAACYLASWPVPACKHVIVVIVCTSVTSIVTSVAQGRAVKELLQPSVYH